MYITDQIYKHGGGERVLTNKSNYLIEKNWAEVYIVTSEQKDMTPCYPINSKAIFKDLGINYNRELSYFHPYNYRKIVKHFFKLKKTIKEINPDVIITLSTQFDFYFLPFIYKNIPKIKEFHSSGFFKNLNRKKHSSFFKKIFFKINDFIEFKYDYLAILTKDEEKYYNSKNKIIIHNALTNYPSKASDLNNKIAISAGRIAPVKQFDKLIKSWSYVANKYPDWQLKIYGNGDYNDVDKLKKIINEYNLNNYVQLCESTDNIEDVMLNSSLYLMSSKTECFPMVLLEAMSCGLPIISFNCPHGPKNIITQNIDGILLEVNDEENLGNAIINLINDKERLINFGKMGRKNVLRFSDDIIMSEWLNLFLSLNKK